MKRWLIALLVLTFAVGSLGMVAFAAKTKMIMLGAGGSAISPKTAEVAKGDTVIWVNQSSSGTDLFFVRGKEVEAVCAAPTRFSLDSEGRYFASIPVGGTASLCFVEAGKYTYTVTREKSAGGAFDGTIIVK